jgi:hypothetical protein
MSVAPSRAIHDVTTAGEAGAIGGIVVDMCSSLCGSALTIEVMWKAGRVVLMCRSEARWHNHGADLVRDTRSLITDVAPAARLHHRTARLDRPRQVRMADTQPDAGQHGLLRVLRSIGWYSGWNLVPNCSSDRNPSTGSMVRPIHSSNRSTALAGADGSASDRAAGGRVLDQAPDEHPGLGWPWSSFAGSDHHGDDPVRRRASTAHDH